MATKDKLPFHIVLLGQVAAGKDTQAEILLEKYNLFPVESGKYWRRLAMQPSKEGELLRKSTALGKPAPVSLMKKFLIEHIQKCPKTKSILFVGNPRLKPEAQLLLKLLKARNEKMIALYITLPDTEVRRRSHLRTRNEDDEKYVNRRIAWHKTQVSKTVNYLSEKKLLKKINGNQSIKKVSEDIEKQIKKWEKLSVVK